MRAPHLRFLRGRRATPWRIVVVGVSRLVHCHGDGDRELAGPVGVLNRARTPGSAGSSGLQSGFAGAYGVDDFANGVSDELRIVVVDHVTAVGLRHVF
jgi:hypothetical protein